MTTYHVKFQRPGADDLVSDPFKTLHAAQAFAARHQIETGIILIVEHDDNGEECQIHEVMKT